MNNLVVAKFGGTSLADASQIKKVTAIIKADPARKYIVVSAPGKRTSSDAKITDMLYSMHKHFTDGRNDVYADTVNRIAGRYRDIISELGIDFDLDAELEAIHAELESGATPDYSASRGEYLNAKIIAKYLGWPFVDASELIRFDDNGNFDGSATYRKAGDRLKSLEHAIIPGFYGTLPDGSIKTFSRGGSDITGSIIACSVDAELYENWTDVSGMLCADPRIVNSPKVIEFITYTELRELSYMGASVLHEDAVFPVRKAGIPINIRNTNRPEDSGTMITASIPKGITRNTVTGIAGRKGFCSIRVEKSQMNGETGFGAKLLQIFSDNGIPFEHCPTGIDTISVIVNSALFDSRKDDILRTVKNELEPDFITIEKNLAAIAVVGQGMVSAKGTAGKIFTALGESGINIRMIDQGSDELNIIIGVDDADCEPAIRTLYSAMIES